VSKAADINHKISTQNPSTDHSRLRLKLLRGDLQLAAAFPAQRFLPGDSASSRLRPGGQAEVSRRMAGATATSMAACNYF